jgi:polyisoprenyl-phosphate glycosyltransferase
MVSSLSVVVPVYNAEATLMELHEQISAAAASCAEEYRIIYVDDAGNDGSFSLISALAAADRRVTGIRLAANSGQQHALLCGIRDADSDYVATIDDDLQYPPRSIAELTDAVSRGPCNLVYGIPRTRSDSPLRSLGTLMTRLLLELFCRKPRGIEVSSLRVMDRALAQAVGTDRRCHVYISAASFLAGAEAAVVPVDTDNSRTSRYSFRRLALIFTRLLLCYALPPRLFCRGARQYEIERTVGAERGSAREV